jgi:ADP-ribose pyrophosphatase
MTFKVMESRQLLDGKAVRVWLDKVQYPDGRVAAIEVVRHPGAVCILPIDEEGKIWFVRQYRHPTGEALLELPAGTLEPDEPPEETARREIREEIGMAAGSLRPLGGFYAAPGYSSEYLYAYRAEELSPAPLPQDEGEMIDVERYSPEEVISLVATGRLVDGKSLAVLLLAKDQWNHR